MVTERPGVSFFFDANLSPRLSQALSVLGESAFHVQDVLGRRVPDEVWLQYAGEREWCIVSQDRNILKRPHERAALTNFRVGAFFLVDIAPSHCKILQTLMRHWPEMKRVAAKTERPFIRAIRQRGVRPLREGR